ncbi:hypothetical protein [Seonamhaeicola sp.]|uniref:hypothetical protein n=1 Tax=Seonamhaeicola sp. TaxID=1912245 RepID=UPI002602BD78|nr:hypothetical protein [Seonamhaeicola sp.]
MKQIPCTPEITLQEAEAHYDSSRIKYNIEGAESHLAYYRDKHPDYYTILLNKYQK